MKKIYPHPDLNSHIIKLLILLTFLLISVPFTMENAFGADGPNRLKHSISFKFPFTPSIQALSGFNVSLNKYSKSKRSIHAGFMVKSYTNSDIEETWRSFLPPGNEEYRFQLQILSIKF